jgi:hypothetical protein
LGLSQGTYCSCTGFAVGKEFLPEKPCEINKFWFDIWSLLGFYAVLVNGCDMLNDSSASSCSGSSSCLRLLEPEVASTVIILIV